MELCYFNFLRQLSSIVRVKVQHFHFESAISLPVKHILDINERQRSFCFNARYRV